MTLQIAILGSVELRVNEVAVPLPAGKQRAVLTLLTVRAPDPVWAETVAEELWPQATPRDAMHSVQVTVSRLRRSLGAAGAALETVTSGYRLAVEAEAIDARRFEQLSEEGHRALADGEPQRAAGALRQALSLWRGPALADCAFEAFAQAEIRRLEEERLAALEARVDADLALGRHAELAGELAQLVAAHPLREHLRGQLMLSLYRSGRQGDALQAYRDARDALVEQLGVEPGTALRELEGAILRQDRSIREPVIALQQPPRRRRTLPPAPVSRLFGRARECEEIAGVIRAGEARLVTLVGPGGVGKTRLAFEVAHLLTSDFRDGAWLVELAPIVSPDDVAGAVAEAIGVAIETGETPAEACTRYLASQHGLLVVDNVEHVLAAAPLFSRILAAAPELVLLATSREPLELEGEHRYSVAPLELPARDPDGIDDLAATAATALLITRARESDLVVGWSDDDATALAEICRRLDGLPLAIELATPRLAVLSPNALAARLHDALGTLDHGRRDAAARHRTLRATIDWSFELLDPHERAAFSCFAVFAGGANVEDALGVLQTELSTLEGLVAKQLLVHRRRVGEDRLEMLETIRQYAHHRFAALHGVDALRERHAHRYLAHAEAGAAQLRSRARRDALARLTAELENFRAALTFALDSGRTALAIELCAALGEYWWSSHRDAEGLRWIDTALAHPRHDDAPDRQLARSRYWRGRYVLRVRDDLKGQADEIERALALYRRAKDDAGIAACSYDLGMQVVVHWPEGPARAAEGLRLAEQALGHAEVAGDRYAIASALQLRSNALPFPEALPIARDAARRFAELGCDDDVASCLADVAYTAILTGVYNDADRLLEEALPAARQALNPHRVALTLSNLGLARLFLQDFSAASRAFSECLDICKRTHTRFLIWEPLLGSAALAAEGRAPAAAARLYGASGALRINAPRNAVDDVLEHRFLAPARTALGTVDWNDALQAGEQLGFTKAIDVALAVLALEPIP